MTAPLADTVEDLTAEWFTAALRDGGAIAGDVTVTSADSGLLGSGQFGLVARAHLAYDDPNAGGPASVVVKLPSDDESARQLGVMIGAYESEVRFYQEFADRVDTALPDVYWSGFEPGTGRVTIVLEDLCDTRDVGDAMAGGTLEEARAALDQLVKFQAPLWDHAAVRGSDFLGNAQSREALFGTVAPNLEVFKEKIGRFVAPEHIELIERLAPKAAEYPAKAWDSPLVITHGDYRLDNLMFSRGGPPLDAMVIDWQAVRNGPPMIDAAIYLSSCLPPDVRRAHQDDLLREYHAGLVAGGVENWSFTDVMESYRRGCLYPLLLGVGVGTMLKQTERGAAMFGALVDLSAALAIETDAADWLLG